MRENICYSQCQDSRLFILFMFDILFYNLKSPKMGFRLVIITKKEVHEDFLLYVLLLIT